jgi:hypothetical protein
MPFNAPGLYDCATRTLCPLEWSRTTTEWFIMTDIDNLMSILAFIVISDLSSSKSL